MKDLVEIPDNIKDKLEIRPVQVDRRGAGNRADARAPLPEVVRRPNRAAPARKSRPRRQALSAVNKADMKQIAHPRCRNPRPSACGRAGDRHQALSEHGDAGGFGFYVGKRQARGRPRTGEALRRAKIPKFRGKPSRTRKLAPLLNRGA